ncbi:MAG: permease-like cell division protein FtsX [bacterium]|nr:permease-like cell division protein FtsX [bacterium]
MITLWRIFKTGFRNLFRNAWLSAAATAIMVVTLVIVSFFAFSALLLNSQLNAIKDKINLTIFITDEAKLDDIKNLQAKLLADNNVLSVEYISKNDALNKLSNRSEKDKEIAKLASEVGNPLQASLEVKTKDPGKINQVVRIAKQPDYSKIVAETSYDEDRKKIVDRIVGFSGGVAKAGTVVSVAFLTISLLIIFNTIRMAIFTRREEIEIMQLVGATNWFIRGPFIVEGAMYGVIGATIAVLISFGLMSLAKPFMSSFLFSTSEVTQFFNSKIVLIVAGEFLLGIIIGATSSLLAISRHLKL